MMQLVLLLLKLSIKVVLNAGFYLECKNPYQEYL